MTDENAYVGTSGRHPGKVCLIKLNSLVEAEVVLAVSPARAKALAEMLLRSARWQEEGAGRPPLILPPAEGVHDLSCDVYKMTPGECTCGENADA